MAYDIGLALKEAHLKNIIHRDIKLENIFYSDSDHRYKLGDFGISCITDDGMASTVAFTKGYGAPEVVGTLEDKYDCTADIYSFGMTLYVLINKLRFPSSKNYHPNIEQYKKKTVGMAIASISAAGLNYLLNMIFIPKFGYIAAAYTTLASFLWLMLIHMFLVYRIGYANDYDQRIITPIKKKKKKVL